MEFTISSNVTLDKYLAYRIAQCGNEFNVLLHGNKLYQQRLVDQYCKMETARMRWVISSQKRLRSDLYQGVLDSVRHGDLERSGFLLYCLLLLLGHQDICMSNVKMH
jgi:Helitron helicase-like domain at N-terminus